MSVSVTKYVDPNSVILDWRGKRDAFLLSKSPVKKSFHPAVDESVDFDSTDNLFIEGDNLDALKLLRKTHKGKVKLIYIDPPYNTGKKFVYNDKIVDWLSMVYSRILLARDLLSDDGVMFISIDDKEQSNLKTLCDEVFGVNNFITNIIWQRTYAPVTMNRHFSKNHDFILCFAKNKSRWNSNSPERGDACMSKYKNPDNDPRGVWVPGHLFVGMVVENQVYPITTPTGRVVYPPKARCWRVTKERFKELLDDNRIWFGKDGSNKPARKVFLNEVRPGVVPLTVWPFKEVGHSRDATEALKKMFHGEEIFNYPKPVDLIKKIVHIGSSDGDTVLDFFAGSSTTAHATMELNASDGGNRKFIMVQIPDECDIKSQAYKAGYENIAEISKERIRRAGKFILSSPVHADWNMDVGFKVLHIGETAS